MKSRLESELWIEAFDRKDRALKSLAGTVQEGRVAMASRRAAMIRYRRRADARLRWAETTPAPVLVGGLRMPSSSSLSTTALLQVSFREANSSVRRFFFSARWYSLRRSASASGWESSFIYFLRKLAQWPGCE